MVNILFVTDNLKYGGVTNALFETLKRLDKKRFCIDLLILHFDGELITDIPENISIIKGGNFYSVIDDSISSLINKKNILGIIKKINLFFLLKTGLIVHRIKSIRKKLNLRDYDVEVAYKDGFCTVFTYSGNVKRKIAWIHNDYEIYNASERYYNTMRNAFLAMDIVCSVSSRAGVSLSKKYKLLKEPITISNPVDDDKIRNLAELCSFEIRKDEFSFVSVGRLCDQKGFDRLLRIHVKLLGEGHKHRIYIVGQGEDKEYLDSEIKNNNVMDSFILIGYRDNPYPYIKNADFFVLSSRHEGYAIVVLESFILQTPVISTDVADVRERLDDKFGILTENNETALYNGMKYILTNQDIVATYKNNLYGYSSNSDICINRIESILDK